MRNNSRCDAVTEAVIHGSATITDESIRELKSFANSNCCTSGTGPNTYRIHSVVKSKLTSLIGAPITDNVIAIRKSAADGTEVDAIETAVDVILFSFMKLFKARSVKHFEWGIVHRTGNQYTTRPKMRNDHSQHSEVISKFQ